jgi:peptidoglycan hydrolase-like protein with peptidoglycan-binding domain
VAGGAALLAIGGLIGSSFVKSPQQIAADTAAPPATATTAKVVSQILTSSVQMRGVVYPGTQYDVYPSAPETGASGTGTGSPAGGSGTGGGSSAAVYISRLDVAAGQTISNGEKLAEIDGEPLFALAGRVPAWRDITPGESGPDVAELQKALASLGYYTGGDTPGFFGTPTQDAVSLYYEHLGYTAPATGGVPVTDVIFLPSLPAKVILLNGAKGQQPGQPFLELAARGSLALTGELPPAYAAQVKAGLKVKIFDEVTGINAAGAVTGLGTATTLAPTGTIVNVGGGSGAVGSAGATGAGSTGSGSTGAAGSAGSSNSGGATNPGAPPFIPLTVQPS